MVGAWPHFFKTNFYDVDMSHTDGSKSALALLLYTSFSLQPKTHLSVQQLINNGKFSYAPTLRILEL